MSKRTTVTAIYVANECEKYLFTVKIPNDFPDALDEARMQAVKGVREMLASAIALTDADQASD